MFAKNDLGIDNLFQYCTQYNAGVYINEIECSNSLSKFLGNGQIIDRLSEKIYTYNNEITTKSALAASGNALFGTRAMNDGSFISFEIREYTLWFVVDTNGKKAPNKLGHDIFLFTLNNKDFISGLVPDENISEEEILEGIENGAYPSEWQQQRAGNPCNLTTKRKGNGIGCAYYALMDKCPYDKSRRYFECLP